MAERIIYPSQTVNHNSIFSFQSQSYGQLEYILFMLKEVGTPGVPSLNSLKQFNLINEENVEAVSKVCMLSGERGCSLYRASPKNAILHFSQYFFPNSLSNI